MSAAFATVWASSSVIAFLALRKLAIRDFGIVTVGGLIGLIVMSLLGPFALITACGIALTGGGDGFLNRAVWTDRGEQ